DPGKLLVISSYDENELWTNDLATSIYMYMATIDNVSCDIVNLENSLINDSLTFEKVSSNIMAEYRDKHPDYVVMIGNFSFNLRQHIQEAWGDIPLLLISRSFRSGSLSDYYTSNTDLIPDDFGKPLEDIRRHYNVALMIIPDYCEPTVDLMVRMNPKMKEFLFFTTNIFVQRRAAQRIEAYLKKEYPSIKFRMIMASEEGSETFHEYIVREHPEVGILMGSWVFETVGVRGNVTLTTNDLRMMASSKNPIYSLREAYMKAGCVGGVFVDNVKIKQQIHATIRQMLDGVSMHDVPTYVAGDTVIRMDYPLMQKYKMSANNCPEGTVFTDRPATFWEMYFWQVIVCILLALVALVYLTLKLRLQKKKIDTLKDKETFINKMPIPYASVDLAYDDDGNVTRVAYRAMNRAYKELLEQNSYDKKAGLLFNPGFLAEKANEMRQQQHDVRFTYFFENTNTYYEFTGCSVGTEVRNYANIANVDVFAINMTEQCMLANEIQAKAEELTDALSEKMEKEQALMVALDKANETDRMKSAFLASMSHEIRTPLNAIVGFSNLIVESVENEEFTQFAEIINTNNDLLLTIIGDVLDFAKIESNTIDLVKVPTDINEVISSTANTVRFRVQKGVQVKPMVHDTPCVTLADFSRVSQIVINLLTNACKFTSQGAITSGYEIRDDGMIYIYVTDTGRGIEKDKLEEVFEQFVKLDSFTQGTGLGLSISKKLVTLMGGEIGVRSDGIGCGCTFWFTLPYIPCDVEEFVNEAEATIIGTPDEETPVDNRKKILVAEDNDSNYLLVEQYLKRDYQLTHVYNGEEAVKVFQTLQPDVILMDIGMPVMDGYEATEQIRKLSTEVPIIALTAYAFVSDKEKIMKSGFNGYVSKPVSKQALQKVLEPFVKEE
ncbi:MAG: response regulator, partial [Bacteroidaceae bacterium]|nr:response regulator [Bacteroidaceae bacterium]